MLHLLDKSTHGGWPAALKRIWFGSKVFTAKRPCCPGKSKEGATITPALQQSRANWRPAGNWRLDGVALKGWSVAASTVVPSTGMAFSGVLKGQVGNVNAICGGAGTLGICFAKSSSSWPDVLSCFLKTRFWRSWAVCFWNLSCSSFWRAAGTFPRNPTHNLMWLGGKGETNRKTVSWGFLGSTLSSILVAISNLWWKLPSCRHTVFSTRREQRGQPTAWAHPFLVKSTHVRKVNPSGAKRAGHTTKHGVNSTCWICTKHCAHWVNVITLVTRTVHVKCQKKHNRHTTKHGVTSSWKRRKRSSRVRSTSVSSMDSN